eukprot:EG_transcript_19972
MADRSDPPPPGDAIHSSTAARPLLPFRAMRRVRDAAEDLLAEEMANRSLSEWRMEDLVLLRQAAMQWEDHCRRTFDVFGEEEDVLWDDDDDENDSDGEEEEPTPFEKAQCAALQKEIQRKRRTAEKQLARLQATQGQAAARLAEEEHAHAQLMAATADLTPEDRDRIAATEKHLAKADAKLAAHLARFDRLAGSAAATSKELRETHLRRLRSLDKAFATKAAAAAVAAESDGAPG